MQEVLKSLSDTMSLLEAKLNEVAKKEELLKNAKKDAEAIHAKNVAAENSLRAKERVLVKYDDLDKEIEKAKQNTDATQKEKSAAMAKTLELSNKIEEHKKKEKELDETRDLFKKKNIGLDEQLKATKELQDILKAKLVSLGIK